MNWACIILPTGLKSRRGFCKTWQACWSNPSALTYKALYEEQGVSLQVSPEQDAAHSVFRAWLHWLF